MRKHPCLPLRLWSIALSHSLLVALTLLCSTARGQHINSTEVPEPEPPTVADASNEGIEAIKTFSFTGLECELFAAEPDVANVVAFHRDYQGRLFVCESFRQENGIEDNRNHAHWMNEELQAQTVQDRIDYIKKYFPDAEKTYQTFDDRIRVLKDTDGDSKADQSIVFANRFNAIEMGTGAGVLSWRDSVYYTCIPNLFLLKDTDGDGVSDQRRALSSGYGVRFALRGHDMHGLIVGPDGRLYFSIGDRGYNVAKNMRDPASGAVFRCELDGSHLEVFATGLRNPQELAFDDFGNLFTGDNNSDGGDKARWVYVVEGGDSGWRMHYQYAADRGPFGRELIWAANSDQTPAYVVPPVANISDGPAGLEYYPGTGFSDDFKGRFFLCDFRGGAEQSGIRSLKNKPVGAFFKLADNDKPIWQALLTDLDFGSDGKLYVSDWVRGWVGRNKGRIYAFYDKQHINDPIVKEVEALLRDGLAKKPANALQQLLGHVDQRVRQEAQFELVQRKDMASLTAVVNAAKTTLPRLHAIWGMEQLLRAGVSKGAANPLAGFDFRSEKDPQILRYLVRVAAEHLPNCQDRLESLCGHADANVQYESAMGLGKIGDASSLKAIVELILRNNNQDPIVRHGAIMAIRGIAIRESETGESGFINKLLGHKKAAVRLATTVALRKQHQFNLLNSRDSAQVIRALAGLIGDVDETVRLEAARAVHDMTMDDAMLPLAKLIESEGLGDPLLRRAISANNRVGDKESAMRLAKFATRTNSDVELRRQAIGLLGEWAKPNPLDPVSRAWREIDASKRNVADAVAATSTHFDAMLVHESGTAAAAVELAANLQIKPLTARVAKVVTDRGAAGEARTAALLSLEKLNPELLSGTLDGLQQEAKLPDVLRSALVDVISRTDPNKAIGLLKRQLLATASEPAVVLAQQKALRTIGEMTNDASDKLLVGQFDRLKQGGFPRSLELDLLLAAESRGDTAGTLAKKFNAKVKAAAKHSERFPWAMFGGDAERGRKVFFNKTEVSCQRCHQVEGRGGNVGPDLTGIGARYSRREVLESIVEPNQKIAPGFGQLVVLDDEGVIHTGIVKEETDTTLSLLSPEGKVIKIDVDAIEDREQGQSSMPEKLEQLLTREELRDLVEYLATLKQAPESKEPVEEGH